MSIFTDWKIDTPVHEAVFQALGAASTCWSTPEGAGVFDSERCAAIGEELMAFLASKLWVEARQPWSEEDCNNRLREIAKEKQ